MAISNISKYTGERDMKLTETMAQKLLSERDRTFMAADIDAYMKLWADDGSIEMGSMQFSGAKNIRDTIVFAWSMTA